MAHAMKHFVQNMRGFHIRANARNHLTQLQKRRKMEPDCIRVWGGGGGGGGGGARVNLKTKQKNFFKNIFLARTN